VAVKRASRPCNALKGRAWGEGKLDLSSAKAPIGRADGGGGEARRLDLTVTHPLLLLLRPMSSSPDPLFLVFFGSADPHNNFYGSWELQSLMLFLICICINILQGQIQAMFLPVYILLILFPLVLYFLLPIRDWLEGITLTITRWICYEKDSCCYLVYDSDARAYCWQIIIKRGLPLFILCHLLGLDCVY